MKQVVVRAPYDVRLDDVPCDDRAPGPYELRVQTGARIKDAFDPALRKDKAAIGIVLDWNGVE